MRKRNLLYCATFLSLIKILTYKQLWNVTIKCVQTIFTNFFLLQFKGRSSSSKTAISHVDHLLDAQIPFTPKWVKIYMDFSPFWIRTQGFLLEKFGQAAVPYVTEFIDTIIDLYNAAASVSRQNFSTTKRPRYYGKLNFIVIHLFDPHLMCIPSLHVMLVVCTFIKFQKSLEAFNDVEPSLNDLQWARDHAIAITESILYVKQHSVNCIPAALYTMTSYDKTLFNQETLKKFIEDLFINPDNINSESVIKIKNHIVDLYDTFLTEGTHSETWQTPLLDFLKNY